MIYPDPSCRHSTIPPPSSYFSPTPVRGSISLELAWLRLRLRLRLGLGLSGCLAGSYLRYVLCSGLPISLHLLHTHTHSCAQSNCMCVCCRCCFFFFFFTVIFCRYFVIYLFFRFVDIFYALTPDSRAVNKSLTLTHTHRTHSHRHIHRKFSTRSRRRTRAKSWRRVINHHRTLQLQLP